ncbi:MAG: hypothetical protein KDK39_19975, partial [Leptospiraceae bacterium]|nr:hypothetical protein [Leptospiraceae bacterium]
MLKLIWRQILHNYRVLTPIVLVWILAGFWIIPQRNQWFQALNSWWLEFPPPGERNTARATRHYEMAAAIIAEQEIDLQLLARSCNHFMPRVVDQPIADYRPH